MSKILKRIEKISDENNELALKIKQGFYDGLLSVSENFTSPQSLNEITAWLNYYDFTYAVSFEDNMVAVMLNEKFYFYKN